MKKVIGLILCLAMVFSLCACGGGRTGDSADDTAKQEESAAEPETGTPADMAESDGVGANNDNGESEESGSRVLVVYYSGTGNTERAAKAIAQAVDADLFEIVPETLYSDDDLDYNDASSRVNREHDDESLRNVALASAEAENWESYDTVFIGYPIWWGIAAWPVSSFVSSNDFTGKTVIPFATSASSGIGDSASQLADLAATGDWQEGQRFSSGVSDEDITAWALESLS